MLIFAHTYLHRKKGRKMKKTTVTPPDPADIIATETLSDASKLLREAKAASGTKSEVQEFEEPGEPAGFGFDNERRIHKQ